MTFTTGYSSLISYEDIQRHFRNRAKAAIKGKLFWDSASKGTYINPLKAKAKRNDSQ